MSDLVFPSSLAGFGVKVTREPYTDVKVQESLSGRELRSTWWTTPRYRYKVQFPFARTPATFKEFQSLVSFFVQHFGRLDSFLLEDPEDCMVTEHGFGVGDGSTTAFQLQRRLEGYSWDRTGGPWKTSSKPRTNYCVQSQAFDESPWSASNLGAYDPVLAPDGSSTGQSIYAVTTNLLPPVSSSMQNATCIDASRWHADHGDVSWVSSPTRDTSTGSLLVATSAEAIHNVTVHTDGDDHVTFSVYVRAESAGDYASVHILDTDTSNDTQTDALANTSGWTRIVVTADLTGSGAHHLRIRLLGLSAMYFDCAFLELGETASAWEESHKLEQTISGLTQGDTYTARIYVRVSSGTEAIKISTTEGEHSFTIADTWQVCSFSFVASSSSTVLTIGSSSTWAVDHEFMLWGCQVEDGADMTEYIPTTTAALRSDPFYWPDYTNGFEPVYAPGHAQVFVNGYTETCEIGSTGLVTFDSAPADLAVLTWTGSHYRRVRLDNAGLSTERIVHQLWKTGTIDLVSVI
jgi:hypothetical protein